MMGIIMMMVVVVKMMILVYRDVDKRTRLGRLEKVKKPIEAGVVAIHPDELKSENYIRQYVLTTGCPKNLT